MKLTQFITVSVALVLLGAGTSASFAADVDGVAIAIVYDTSGSMAENVQDESGKPAPKYRIANRALAAIANRIQTFATNTTAGSPRTIRAALFVFQDPGARAALPMAPFDAAAFVKWSQSFTRPEGGTPLGNALVTAGQAVLKSGLTRKHVLVITDGMNTVGPDPATTLPKLLRDAAQQETGVSVHFVAFDVDARAFSGVKKLGATVVGATNEQQLNTQLEFILEKKILLEEEETPAKK